MLDLRGIGKSFPGVTALNNVSLAVSGGEIRGLMGENGAGKSTLLKILSGEYPPDTGDIRIDGHAARFGGPRGAAQAGVAIIHQELNLAPHLSVAENMTLGVMPSRGGLLDRNAMRRQARALLERVGEDIDPDARLGTLSIGKRQMVEVCKALHRDARIIAFDEPTSSLSARETGILLRVIRDLRAEGRAILYVSHRMEEVFALCDSLTVLRDGRLAAEHPQIAAVSPDRVISEMAGREISDVYGYRPRAVGGPALEARGVLGPGLSAPVSFQAGTGEILGLFGLVGAGRTELLKLIYGASPLRAGTLAVNGKAVSIATPRDAIAAGLALLPEDRKDEGIVPMASVQENIVMAERNLAGGGCLLRPKGEASQAQAQIRALRIKTASADTAIGSLSGGNQQKAVLGRWLAAEARILLMDEPTRGIDIGARSEIYALLYRLAEEGRTLVVVSSDMPEVLGICDRIIVMREGAISAVLNRADATPDALLRHALPDAGRRGDAA